jgi:hypothetical protein
MPEESRAYPIALLFIVVFALGFSLFTNLKALQKNFLFADEAVYFMMADSLAQDGDIEYTRTDLIRYYRELNTDPKGIFLKKAKDGRLFYAKSWAYPLLAAPFVRLFGINGFLVLHALFLGTILGMGFLYAAGINAERWAFLAVFTFLFGSVAVVYYLWLTPDFFNLWLVFTVLFLWLYKHTGHRTAAAGGGRLQDFLLSDGSDYLACALAGLAAFSKPPNLALLGPLVLFTLIRKRRLKALAMILIFTAVAAGLFGVNQAITGEWNYQGGDRKTFYGEGGYPLEKEHLTFETAVSGVMSADGYFQRHLYYPRVYLADLFYYFFGRFTGLAWYFFPALAALILFFARRKRLHQWLVFLTLAGEILIFVILMPDNYAGGGGALANRYFLSIYPLFFFLPPQRIEARSIGLSWLVASVFIAQILVNPLPHSHFPATHAKRAPFKLLPVELPLINNLPTNTNPAARRQSVGEKYTWLYFLDDNFIPRTNSELERFGFWTRGSHRAEMIIKTYYPIKEITFRLRNNHRLSNRITVVFGGERRRMTLGYKGWGTVTFSNPRVFRMNQWIHLYTLSVRAAKGSVPHFEEEGSDERRDLGVWFEVDIVPEYMPD